MAPSLSSRERLLKTIKEGRADRVPILSPIPWSPLGVERRGWRAERNYLEVLGWVEQYCDFIGGSGGLEREFDRRFLLIPWEFVEVASRERRGDWVEVTYRVRTPKGDLYTRERRQEGVDTVWYVEPLVKTVEDAKKLLSVPFYFEPFDLKPFFEYRDALGERGLPMLHVSTPLVCVSRLLQFEQFFIWCLTERALIKDLIEAAFERIYVKLEYALKGGVGPLIWFGGCEQATPPMTGPELFDELVVAYDRRLYELVHRYGGLVYTHCHGRVATVFEKFIEMGSDLLDPLEPPPDGDLPLAEAKRRAAGRLTLVGGIQFRDLELSDPDEVERKVEQAICEGGKEHYILAPTATAISRISDRMRENCIRYIQAGLKYGLFE